MNELNKLKKLKDSLYVVQLVESKTDEENIYMILTYGNQGNISDYLKKNDLTSFTSVIDAFKKIFAGVDNIHKAGYVHANLKPQNILVDQDGDPIICGLDLSVEINTTGLPRGDPLYMAPEVMKSYIEGTMVEFSDLTDLYSLSVMFYEIFSGVKPYYLFGMKYNVLMNTEIYFDKDQPKQFFDFIELGIKPVSHRACFEEAQDFLKLVEIDEDDVNEESYSYKMISYADLDEKRVTIKPLGNYNIMMVYLILLCLTAYFILKYFIKFVLIFIDRMHPAKHNKEMQYLDN
jgi:serine/threonine protein kinase